MIVAVPHSPVPPADLVGRLSPREREVMSLIAQGYSNAAICEKLVITAKTLERHVSTVFHKLELPASDPLRHRRVCATLAWLGSPASRGWLRQL